MDLLEQAPAWLLRPLPANAAAEAALEGQIDALAAGLPGSLFQISRALEGVRPFREYDSAANRAVAHVGAALGPLLASDDSHPKHVLLGFALAHMPGPAQARVFRRLVKDRSPEVRRQARKLLARARIHEVALPLKQDGAWDSSGWLHGTPSGPLSRHPQGRRVQQRSGVPPLAEMAGLRQLLGIKSSRQLGWLLLASDQDDGPYTTFTIPKRSGGERLICAPKWQLRRVQRRILDQVLAPVAAHEAAHGFVRGRSTVSNAAAHQGALLLLKFDLADFFPTVHYYRVVGLFARLGYAVGNARFYTEDEARQVAPALARLCCYTPDPRAWDQARLPQGAPTSPAISNLVCRRLDARLTGLARGMAGVYTRYADDLTFSFKAEDVHLGRFRWWVNQVCHQEGFLVNEAKFRVIRRSQRQLVTGIVVNDELRVPRDARRRFRAVLHNCRAHGVASQARGNPRFADWLRGFASYVHMVHPDEGADLLRQVRELLGPAEGEDRPEGGP
jgi:hypothetical protein